MSKSWLIPALSINALVTIGSPLAAMVFLDLRDYAVLASILLSSSLVQALGLGIITDPWIRGGSLRSDASGYLTLVGVLSVVSIATTLAAIGLIQAFGAVSIIASVGAGAAMTGRYLLRFVSIEIYGDRRALMADCAGLLASAFVFAMVFNNTGRTSLDHFLLFLVVAYGVSASILAAGIFPTLALRAVGRAWIRNYGADSRFLLRDSLLGTLSGVVVPYLLLPILGVTGFGLYRAVTSLGAPSRLLIQPARGRLREMPSRWFAQPVGWAGLLVLGGMLSGLLVALLYLVRPLVSDEATLSAITTVTSGVFLFSTANFVLQAAWTRARLVAQPVAVGRARNIHLLVTTVSPMLGGIFGGVKGGILGLGFATLVAALFWGYANREREQNG